MEKEIIDTVLKKFREKFVCDTDPDEHPFVAFYDEEDNKFEFWNAYKIEKFLDEEITNAYNEGKNKNDNTN